MIDIEAALRLTRAPTRAHASMPMQETGEHHSGHAHGRQGAAQVVAKHCQEGVAGAQRLVGVGDDGLRQRLVDGFVEADHLVGGGVGHRAADVRQPGASRTVARRARNSAVNVATPG